MFDKKIILASKSPRRAQLLREAGFDFEVKTIDVVESYPMDLPVEDVPAYLARKKARESLSLLEEGSVLLTADSIVVLGGEIYGKPDDREDAIRTLRKLSGKVHKVITGVCIRDEDKEVSFSGESKVFMADLTLGEIHYYVDAFEPYDKAGAYAVQEWIGLCKVNRIEGSYANIMGLPVHLVYQELMRF